MLNDDQLTFDMSEIACLSGNYHALAKKDYHGYPILGSSRIAGLPVIVKFGTIFAGYRILVGCGWCDAHVATYHQVIVQRDMSDTVAVLLQKLRSECTCLEQRAIAGADLLAILHRVGAPIGENIANLIDECCRAIDTHSIATARENGGKGY